MVNIERLRAIMKEKDITVEQAAEKIGMHPTTFYRKINRNGGKFTITEVEKLAEMLNLDGATLEDIFFEKKFA